MCCDLATWLKWQVYIMATGKALSSCTSIMSIKSTILTTYMNLIPLMLPFFYSSIKFNQTLLINFSPNPLCWVTWSILLAIMLKSSKMPFLYFSYTSSNKFFCLSVLSNSFSMSISSSECVSLYFSAITKLLSYVTYVQLGIWENVICTHV